MKINGSQMFVVEMSFEELMAIKKMIGATSTRFRMEELHLSAEQDKAAEKMYSVIGKYIDES